jgi:hypothetical protein
MRSKVDVAEGYDAAQLPLPLSGKYSDGPAPAMCEGSSLPLATALAQIQELSAELNRLRTERERWTEQQLQVMELLASKSPDRIIHDLRNVLNERELFRSLADLGE